MSRDLILTDEADIRYSMDNLCTQKWLEGHESGLDAAVSYLRERAVNLFRDGKDDEAIRLRRLAEDMAKELRPQMRERAAEHAKDFPSVLATADDEDEP